MKKTLALLLAVILLLSTCIIGIGITASALTPSPDADFIVFDGIIEEYFGPGGTVVVPAVIDGEEITEIAGYAFANNSDISEVYIAEGIEVIGNRAFYGCSNLYKVELPYSLLVAGSQAFGHCAIEEITIPGNLKKVEFGAFGSNALSKITISYGVKEIHTSAFSSNLTCNVVFPETVDLICGFSFVFPKNTGNQTFTICNPDCEIGYNADTGYLNNNHSWNSTICPISYSAIDSDAITKYVFPEGSAAGKFAEEKFQAFCESTKGSSVDVSNNRQIIQYNTQSYFRALEESQKGWGIVSRRTDLTFANPGNNSSNPNNSDREDGNFDRDPTDSTGNNQSSNNSSTNKTPTHTHSFGAWSVTASANCTDMGKETRTCSGCGATETKSTNALGHNFKTPTITKQPTCTETGVESGICTRCGKNATNVIAAKGHKIENYTVTLEATCTKAGKLQGLCLNCSTIAEQEIPMKEHTYKQETLNGVLVEKCTVCSAIKENDLAENDSQSADANAETKKSNNIVWIIVGIVAVAVISGGVTFLLLKKKPTNKTLAEELPEETVDAIPAEENLD